MACEPQAPSRRDVAPASESPDLSTLLHRLNNQLGIILANAELLETKLDAMGDRSRASQIVNSVVDAIGTARDIHVCIRRR